MTLEERGKGGSRYVHVGEANLQTLRSVFNRKTIFAPRGEIMPAVAIDDAKNPFVALFSGKNWRTSLSGTSGTTWPTQALTETR